MDPSPKRASFSMARSPGARLGPHPPTAFQAKLAINKPGDAYEQEADRLSERVMRMPEPKVQRCSCGGACSKCQEEEHGKLQTKRLRPGDQEEVAAPPIVQEVLAGPAQSLDLQTRGFMETRFGHDFKHVRVHTDRRASESAKAVRAQAYTVGRDIVFGAGQYAPQSEGGKRLLAHELTHTLQQGSAQELRRQPKPEEKPEKEERCPLGEMRLGPGMPCFPFTMPGRDCPAGQLKLAKDAPCIPWRERRPTLFDTKLKLDPTLTPPSLGGGGGAVAPAGSGGTGGTGGTVGTGCTFTVTYSNPRDLDCATVWKRAKGTDPPEPLCGRGLEYDITSVSASGSGCPAKLEGLEVSEVVSGDQGCTPPGFVWPPPKPCKIGPGGKLTGCTDMYSLCGPARNLGGNCTEVVTQQVLVGGKVAETHKITFKFKKDALGCSATVTRS